MIFYYIRHGDPIYAPDSLTPLGHRQADAVARRLAVYGLDKIYCSTSVRAKQTAQPTCELLHMEMELLDFTHENHAADDLSIYYEDGTRKWVFQDESYRQLFFSRELRAMGDDWVKHPAMQKAPQLQAGIERIWREGAAFFASLGYEHIPGTGSYRALRHNPDRIALFAHHGFGIAFLSTIFDIPYPQFVTHFDMQHSGMTVIEFPDDEGDIVIPRMLILSDDAHLYKTGLPTCYNNELRF